MVTAHHHGTGSNSSKLVIELEPVIMGTNAKLWIQQKTQASSWVMRLRADHPRWASRDHTFISMEMKSWASIAGAGSRQQSKPAPKKEEPHKPTEKATEQLVHPQPAAASAEPACTDKKVETHPADETKEELKKDTVERTVFHGETLKCALWLLHICHS